jgi:hypothetical protein
MFRLHERGRTKKIARLANKKEIQFVFIKKSTIFAEVYERLE